MKVVPFRWRGRVLDILDQRLLPHKTLYLSCRTPRAVARAIQTMAVRGAPAIGCCAAYGMALAATSGARALRDAGIFLKAARPTAVNLAWAVDRVAAAATRNGESLFDAVLREARAIEREDQKINEAIGRNGAALFKKPAAVLTHCNTGALATAGYGTALGVIRTLAKDKKILHVWVDETRPYFQGARLTAWELAHEKIPYFLITDSMAAHMMRTERVDAVIVGCDRVAANGDTANKIGTYGLAVAARYHEIPFYVAMPLSTLDLTLSSGARIPIEDRSAREVTDVGPVRLAPKGARARHPAFDVTPAALITAIITEKGVVRPPFPKGLRKIARMTVRA